MNYGRVVYHYVKCDGRCLEEAVKDARCPARISIVALGPQALEALSVRLQELLEERKLSRRKLATLSVGVSIGTVMEIVRGERDPDLGTMLSIAHALKLRSIEELLGPLGTTGFQEHEGRETLEGWGQ